MKGCRPLSENEIVLVEKFLYSQRDKTLFKFMSKTGFRVGEALSLKVSQVHQFGKVTDSVTVARKSMKGKQQGRTVALHSEAKASIELLIAAHQLQPSDFLFKSREGGNAPVSSRQIQKILKHAFNKAELSGTLSTHSCRKTFAHVLFDKLDGNIFKLQKALGHASPGSTVSYISVNQDEIDAAILA